MGGALALKTWRTRKDRGLGPIWCPTDAAASVCWSVVIFSMLFRGWAAGWTVSPGRGDLFSRADWIFGLGRGFTGGHCWQANARGCDLVR